LHEVLPFAVQANAFGSLLSHVDKAGGLTQLAHIDRRPNRPDVSPSNSAIKRSDSEIKFFERTAGLAIPFTKERQFGEIALRMRSMPAVPGKKPGLFF
jgi:hypothetical protein